MHTTSISMVLLTSATIGCIAIAPGCNGGGDQATDATKATGIANAQGDMNDSTEPATQRHDSGLGTPATKHLAGERTDVPFAAEGDLPSSWNLDVDPGDIKLNPEEYDPAKLLEYRGPSTRRSASIKNPVAIEGFLPTDENIKAVDKLLSSQGVSYNIYRSGTSWSSWDHRSLFIVVHSEDYRTAKSVLQAGTNAEKLTKSKLGL